MFSDEDISAESKSLPSTLTGRISGGRLIKPSEIHLGSPAADIIAIQDDADYDLDASWEYTLGQDEMACPADSAGRLIVSVTPYYSAEVASPGDAALRPPCLTNGSESISEEHMLVAVYMGK
jgi:hypothetical protein